VRLNQPQYALALTRAPANGLRVCSSCMAMRLNLFSGFTPACVLVCFSEDVADLRITNPRLSYEERTLLEELQRGTKLSRCRSLSRLRTRRDLPANSCRRLKSCYSAISTAR